MAWTAILALNDGRPIVTAGRFVFTAAAANCEEISSIRQG